ncbi:aerobactin siderophore biosynthesis protein iucB [Bimuria novae-zelandiae CBS 107.79]|uniref:Aerobactin siderophore biosynthesis protein iucB n=1 Tax=Bimuria novae-zelandiae CBS 107.79 TaxID=1447943 RepID=A0A6A5UY27_9PLEO|nr:aerobactin siderophore biosynthesis protein iucB [Bimuria novae-zelandiae CBS 107.79]
MHPAMASKTPGASVHLPNGQNLSITPVFGGLFFKSTDLTNNHSPFPPGWTIVLNSEDEDPFEEEQEKENTGEEQPILQRRVHRYKKPTLHNDHLYISSISNPSSNEFKPASSPTRQIAMMLWATLYWYFHQSEPSLHVTTKESQNTPESGRPEGEWRININREGIFKGKVVLPKLERMGLITSEDSSVGTVQEEGSPEGWSHMFVSRKSFWQLDPRIYLFTLSPMAHSPFPSGSPYPSRPGSPVLSGVDAEKKEAQLDTVSQGLWSPSGPGPFHSSSHLPTYYPPPPPQYVFTNNVRHPLRPKPPRQGETFYTRYIPSVAQYLSFRVASISSKPLHHRGPVASHTPTPHRATPLPVSDSSVPTLSHLNASLSDPTYLHKWMNDPRVSYFWGESGPQSHTDAFLAANLASKHSFPVIGCWDGRPFGYFEIYWVKEDRLGRYMEGVRDYDRGIHCLVGEQEFRGPQRVRVWLSALVHYCFLADLRTESVVLEPRVDNAKLAQYLVDVGFYKEREISFPHKQSNLMKIKRDAWEGPCL